MRLMPDCDKCEFLELEDWSEEKTLNPKVIFTEKYCKLKKKGLKFLTAIEKIKCEGFKLKNEK